MSKELSENTVSLYERLLEDIAAGSFKGGERLKTNDLAKRYGTSSNPVREVLRQLQGEGFVEIEQNKGATVRVADTNSIRDIHEILEMLEPYFCAWFAEFSTPEQIEELVKIQQKIEQLVPGVDNRANFVDLDSQFHGIVYLGHYNKRALNLWTNLRKTLRVYTVRLPLLAPRLKSVAGEHGALIKSFKANDPEAARSAQQRHIASAGELMYKQLRAMISSGRY